MRVRDYRIARYDWHVTVYYAVTCYYAERIVDDLRRIECPDNIVERVRDNLAARKLDSGFTYSNPRLRSSVMVVGLASSQAEFFNSFTHELRHLVDDIAAASMIALSGERVAYLTGEAAMMCLPDVHDFICCQCGCRRH